jgi:hypothetical protein
MNLTSPLAKTISRRMLKTLRDSKHGCMDFGTLIRAAKTEKWLELSKQVFGELSYLGLTEYLHGTLVGLRRSPHNYVGMDAGDLNYELHLYALKVYAETQMNHIATLLKDFKAGNLGDSGMTHISP